MLDLEFKDTIFPFEGINHSREISRAFVLDEYNRIAIHFIERNDLSGYGYYIETPGGGIDEGETPEIAVIRECDEELGCKVEIIEKVAIIKDYYNILKRENHNHYFLCRKKEVTSKHLVSYGDTLIKDTKWLDIDDVIKLYEDSCIYKIGNLVSQRELPVLKEVKRIINNF